MVEYFRVRRRLWEAAGLVVGTILVGWNVAVPAATFFPQYAIRNDLRLAYAAAMVGLQRGYSHLYDLGAQRSAIESLGPDFNPQPFISPPPLAWLVTPLLALPFPIALGIWTVLLLSALIWSWYLLAPPEPLAKAAHLALLLGLFPVAYGVIVGQPGALVAAAVTSAWWLMRRDRKMIAGLVLSLFVLKPQLALLVPFCLLVSGHVRTFGAWLTAFLAMGLASLALLGSDGVARYLDVLAQTQTPAWDITRRYSISGPLGLGRILTLVQVLVLATALFAAWRCRKSGPELPIAAGILGSLLFSPYLAFQDFVMLVIAGWLVLRAGATPLQVAILVVGYALLELALVVLAIPILLAEAALLLSMLWMRPLKPRLPAVAPFGDVAGARVPANAGNPRGSR